MDTKRALVVGGSNGIGLAITHQLLKKEYEKVYIVDRHKPDMDKCDKIEFIRLNLINGDYSVLDNIEDIDTLIITAGFGRICPFESLHDIEICNNFKVNTLAAIKIIKKYYNKINSNENFYCMVMGSIAGLISSPLFSVYGATKAALCKFIESVNIELSESDSKNRILNVSPGFILGTKFDNGYNNISLNLSLAENILYKMFQKEELFIPDYEETYKNVIDRYLKDPLLFGAESYKYKKSGGRINLKPQIKIGYLSGTFDLFHIGHLNLLKRAKEYCDYLVVGIHKDGSHKNKKTFIELEERIEIVRSIKYVDEVIIADEEDSEVYNKIKYSYLFVGSDYKGSKRFERYEEIFKGKPVEIIYFPYTNKTSSTKIRAAIEIAID